MFRLGCGAPPQEKDDEDYAAVPRLALPEGEAHWPQPTNRGPRFWWSEKAHHVGTLSDAPYQLPVGYESRGATRA